MCTNCNPQNKTKQNKQKDKNIFKKNKNNKKIKGGSCYGAEETPGQCCNTCDSIKKAYHKKGWGVPDLTQFEQCKREGTDGSEEKRAMDAGEGCKIFGYISVLRVTNVFLFFYDTKKKPKKNKIKKKK